MNGFKRLINYIKTKMHMVAADMADPRVELEQAVREAHKLNTEYRQNAAMVIAHRNTTQRNLEKQIEMAAKSKENAVTARMKVKEAEEAGNTADVDKWSRVLESMVTEWKTSESMATELKTQFETASVNAKEAERKVNQNSLEMKRLVTQKQKLLSQLEQAKMLETTSKLMQQLNSPVSVGAAPTMTEVEEKIAKRLDKAKASAELNANSVEGAEMEIRHSSFDLEISRGIAELDAELGLAPSPAVEEAKTAEAKADTGDGSSENAQATT